MQDNMGFIEPCINNAPLRRLRRRVGAPAFKPGIRLKMTLGFSPGVWKLGHLLCSHQIAPALRGYTGSGAVIGSIVPKKGTLRAPALSRRLWVLICRIRNRRVGNRREWIASRESIGQGLV